MSKATKEQPSAKRVPAARAPRLVSGSHRTADTGAQTIIPLTEDMKASAPRPQAQRGEPREVGGDVTALAGTDSPQATGRPERRTAEVTAFVEPTPKRAGRQEANTGAITAIAGVGNEPVASALRRTAADVTSLVGGPAADGADALTHVKGQEEETRFVSDNDETPMTFAQEANRPGATPRKNGVAVGTGRMTEDTPAMTRVTSTSTDVEFAGRTYRPF